MKRFLLPLIASTVVASAVLAHSDVHNETVKARMMLMGEIKDATGVIGGMAQGKMAFDAGKAEAARAALAAAAAKVPAAFEANEMDPKSEALPVIWQNWEDFLVKSKALEQAAQGADASSVDGLKAALGQIGGSCGGCHKVYRK